ncbi:hypothetical protein BKA69DRAFT_93962 [Paraphysoderma sedebokerense]|nr:hypothetical protein BKA69DRAFT_93962 [Paraphysoderma sedebokerense]
MYFLLPIALFFSIIIWIQYFVYYAISLPINEVCYSRDTLLSSQIQIASSIYLQPAYVLRGCANGDTFLNVTINAENQTLSSFTGVDFASTFTNYSQIIETLGLNTNRTSLAGDVSNQIAFPNPSNDLNILLAANLNNVSVPNFNSSSPYDIAKIRADLQSLSDNLSPTYINPDYTSSGMQTNLTNFNNACKLAVPAWADWNDTYIIDNFVKTGYTFSAPANVTNNPSDPNNIAIDAAFNTVFADLTYLHYATLQIASMRASIVTIRSSLLDLSNTQITPLNNNLTYLSANLSNLETSINATLSLIPDVETQLNLTLEGLPLLVRNITDDVLSLVDVTVNATFRNISSTIISATECGTIADDVGNVLTTTCGITLNAINGLWVSFFITGVLLFVGFIISVKGAKRLGMKKKIRPDGNKYIDLEGAKWA